MFVHTDDVSNLDRNSIHVVKIMTRYIDLRLIVLISSVNRLVVGEFNNSLINKASSGKS